MPIPQNWPLADSLHGMPKIHKNTSVKHQSTIIYSSIYYMWLKFGKNQRNSSLTHPWKLPKNYPKNVSFQQKMHFGLWILDIFFADQLMKDTSNKFTLANKTAFCQVCHFRPYSNCKNKLKWPLRTKIVSFEDFFCGSTHDVPSQYSGVTPNTHNMNFFRMNTPKIFFFGGWGGVWQTPKGSNLFGPNRPLILGSKLRTWDLVLVTVRFISASQEVSWRLPTAGCSFPDTWGADCAKFDTRAFARTSPTWLQVIIGTVMVC